MPKFGELVATGVWAAAARTLTDISAEEIFDLPIADAFVPSDHAGPSSSATADAFGSWAELVADVGAGKRLIAICLRLAFDSAPNVEVEVGEGASGSEVAIGRRVLNKGATTAGFILPFWTALTDNSRLAVRIRDDEDSALYYEVIPTIA